MTTRALDKTFSSLRKHLLECRDEPAVVATDEEPCHNPIYEALVCDTQAAALLTAVTTSSINGLGDATIGIDPADIKRFAPHEASAVIATGAWEAGVDRAATLAVREFFTMLAEARRALDRYFIDVGQLGAAGAQLLHQRPLAAAWRSACYSAMVAVEGLNKTIPDWLPLLYSDNGAVLLKMLGACETGGWPCLDGSGKPCLPNLPQRRRSARRAVCEPCVLTCRRKSHQAFIRDLSAGGFGLERVPDVDVGELVVVQTTSGRRFTAVVAWRKGQSAGVRLGTPLTPSDPLLAG